MRIESHVALSPLLSIGVGGSARWFCGAANEADLREALDWAQRQNIPVRLLGGGSNVVVSDAGVDALVVRVDRTGIDFVDRGNEVFVTAAAGEPWDRLVRATVERGLAGLECLSGIPGRVGATPIQNVGAYGQEVSDTVVVVEVLDRIRDQVLRLSAEECAFGYRDSRFKSRDPDRYVVLGVTYRLKRGTAPTTHYRDVARSIAERGLIAPTPADVRRVVLEIRRSKSMVLDPADENGRSCGSFFLNPIVRAELAEAIAADAGELPRYPQADGRVKLSAAWLIEHAGLARGVRQGAVGLSTRHCLALVTHPGANTKALLELAHWVRDRVHGRFGVWLTPEPVLWGSDIESSFTGKSSPEPSPVGQSGT